MKPCTEWPPTADRNLEELKKLFRRLKLNAREKLSKGGISLSVAAVMVCFLSIAAGSYTAYLAGLLAGLIPEIGKIEFLLPSIQVFFCAAVLFLFSPLFWGCYRVFVLIARDEKPGLSEVFYYTGNGLYRHALKFSFFLLIRVLANLFLSFIPLILALLLFVFTSLRSSTNPIAGAAIISILAVFGLALFVYLSIFLVYAPTAFTMMPRINCGAHFRRSREICRNQKGDIILFFLSFILWLLPGFFIIPLLWTVPYFFVTLVIFTFHLENRYNNKFKPVGDNINNPT